MHLVPIEAITAFSIAALITTSLRAFLSKRGILDVPNARSSHSIPVPRGGGVSIVLTSLLAAIFLSSQGPLLSDVAMALVGGGAAIAAVGLIDDIRSLRASTRAAVHLAAAVWAVWCLGVPALNLGSIVWDWGWIGSLVAVIGLVWMTNLYNFMDGIDGLGGIEGLSAGALGAVVLANQGQFALATLSLLIACACAGFLTNNWPPAKIFMGDAGSGFLGFAFGVLVIASMRHRQALVWPWLILLGVFVVDATVTLVRRGVRGEPLYAAHRSHAYQHASRMCRSHAKVTATVALINLLWLFPLAWAAIKWPVTGIAVAIAAAVPLIYIARHFGAGETEVTQAKPAVELALTSSRK